MNKLSKLLLIFFAVATSYFAWCQDSYVDLVKTHAEAFLADPRCDVQQIHGGLTNITFSATTKSGKFIVRIGKKNPEILGINRFCETACQQSASELKIAPHVIYSNPAEGILISQFIEAQTLTTAIISDQAILKNMVELIKKYHALPFKKEYQDKSIYKKLRTMLASSRSYQNSFISHEQAAHIRGIIDQIELYFHDKEQEYAGLCHCDLFPPNFMDDGNQLWLIDWEYACWGNILFDLASLCTEASLSKEQVEYVLNIYFGPSWQIHYNNFLMMSALFNLRDALWYDLRSKEIDQLDGYSMIDYANNHLRKFYEILNGMPCSE